MTNPKKAAGLAATMREAAGNKTTAPELTEPIVAANTKSEKMQENRRGKKPVSGYYAPEVSSQLKIIAIQKNVTLEKLLAEAINDLFEKYGQKPIA